MTLPSEFKSHAIGPSLVEDSVAEAAIGVFLAHTRTERVIGGAALLVAVTALFYGWGMLLFGLAS